MVTKGIEFLKLSYRIGIINTIKWKVFALSKVRLKGIKHPLFIRPGTSDSSAFYQVFVANEYKFDLDFEPSFIIDGGSNIGLSTVYFKNRFSNTTIVAIEPDNGNVTMLRKNTEHYSNVYIKHAALWNKNVNVRIYDKYDCGHWGMVAEEFSEKPEHGDEVVNSITISDIVKEFGVKRIDILKLDIETTEKQLFNDNYMEWLPLTKMVIIELHDWISKGCSKPFFEAINKAFVHYSFKQIGENTIIINEDI